MPETCVSDTGPILHLAEIGHIAYLQCLDLISISTQVRNELRQNSIVGIVLQDLNGRVNVVQVRLSDIVVQRRRLQGYNLHIADLSVAALVEKLKPDVILTDDLQLRKALETQGQIVIGSVGIVVRAFNCGIIGKSELHTAIDNLLNGSSLYSSKAFRAHVHGILNHIK